MGGGAIRSVTSTVHFRGSAYFYNNFAAPSSNGCMSAGGVLSAVDSTVVFESSSDLVFFGNRAAIGGAVFMSNSTLKVKGNLVFHLNTALLFGGAIFGTKQSRIYNCEGRVVTLSFVNNNASFVGGAIYSDLSTVELVNVSFERNKATGAGGAITFRQEEQCFHILSCDFLNNSATFGGAVAIYTTRYAIVGGGNNFTHNNAMVGGGAIMAMHSNVTLSGKNCFTKNDAFTGGSIYAASSNSSVSMAGNQFSLEIMQYLVEQLPSLAVLSCY